ncbi:MAG: RuvX/YqgF family protein, partial [Erysipelotrichaceae bacterium]|nr:RuvX/YqgF family protein [Erysipelotrichaceae bacterium]
MRVLGLDLGSVTCGVSISDPLGMIARSVETIRFPEEDYEACLKRVLEI